MENQRTCSGLVPNANPERGVPLAWSVYSYPFVDQEVLARLAEGLKSAGAPAGLGEYLPLTAGNKLDGSAIRSILFGREINGRDFWLGEFPWQQRRTAEGEVEHAGYPIHAGMRDRSTAGGRIADDRLCEQWSFLPEVEICSAVFEDSGGDARLRWGDYVMVTDTGPHPFSVRASEP